MNNRKYRYNPLYKNFLNLKLNPLNNNKFLNLEFKIYKYKTVRDPSTQQHKKIPIWRWNFIINSKKEKWKKFLETQIKSQNFFNRFKPQTIYLYKISKFASQGNSFKKKFKNNLLAKTTFSYLYGSLSRKYLKAKMTQIYTSKKFKNPINICTEFFESRLDSVLYRAKFCKSVKHAQQLIAHKHIKVNNRVEKNKNRILHKGDSVTFNPQLFKQIHINIKQELFKRVQTNYKQDFRQYPVSIIWPLPPNYLNINYKTLEIVMGDITNFNFSNSFTFKQDTHSVITNSYRN